MRYLREFWIGLSALLFCVAVYGQVPTKKMEDTVYPAADNPESKLEAALAPFFEELEVGNLHVFPTAEAEAPLNFFFRGEALPESFFPSMDPEWKEDMPEDLDAYAVYMIKGAARPYYLIRFEGAGARNTIELFEVQDRTLLHKETLARYWCENDQCLQEDSWVQDLNGDTLFDLIKKVRIWDSKANEELIGEYHMIYTQLKDGTFVPTGNIQVELKDYKVEDLSSEMD